MPIWGWVCVGLVAVVLVGVALISIFVWWHGRNEARILREGQTVVARILMAHTSLYDPDDYRSFAGAHVVFTLDDDNSEEHLDYLGRIAERLVDFEADEYAEADERKIEKAIAQQITVGGGPFRIPDRITKGREVYFTTLCISRYKLPKKKLTRDYIYLKVLIDGKKRDFTMIEYPDTKRSHDS